VSARRRRIADILDRSVVMLTLVGVAVLWQLAVRVFDLPTYLIPAPTDILASLVENWRALAFHTQVTLLETLAGFGLSLIIGIPLAVGIVYSRVLERVLYPLLVASQAVPKVALAPILLVGLGYGALPKVIVALLIAFFPVVVNTVTGLRAVGEDTLKLMRSMGTSQLDIFRKVRFPSAVPMMIAGCKVAIAFAVVGAVVGEFVGSRSGLGYYMLVATGSFDTPLVFASVVVLTGLGIVLFYLVGAAELFLGPWTRGVGGGRADDRAGSWSM
jgi:NitT/TauT family transport system permease protein